jgi:hypothetical protein
VRLSDGDHYITAKLTPRAIALLAEQDVSATQIKGAIVSLRKFEKVFSPSKLEMWLVCDELVHLGADGSTPFHNPKDVNQVQTVRLALQSDNNDADMLLMAEVVDQDAASARTAFGSFPFSVQECIIPIAQRQVLKSVDGWINMGNDGCTPSGPHKEYFQEGVGTQMRDAPASESPMVGEDGFYNLVDGISQDVHVSPIRGVASPKKVAPEPSPCVPSFNMQGILMEELSPPPPPPRKSPAAEEAAAAKASPVKPSSAKPSPAKPSHSASLSFSLSPDAVAAKSSPVKQPPAVSSPSCPPAAKMNKVVASASLSFSLSPDAAPAPPKPTTPVKRSEVRRSISLSLSSEEEKEKMRLSSIAPAVVDSGVEIDLSDEELPLFRSDVVAEVVAAPSAASMPANRPAADWPNEAVEALCRGISEHGKDWNAVAKVVGLHHTPVSCEKFFLQYEPFRPDLRAALERYVEAEPAQKRHKSDDENHDNCDDDDDDDDIYEIDDILDERKSASGQAEYFVKWRGWSVADASWVGFDAFVNCDELLAKWKSKQNSKKGEEEHDEFAVPDSPSEKINKKKEVAATKTSGKTARWRPSFMQTKAKKKPKVRNQSISDSSLSSRLALQVLMEKMRQEE